MHRICVVLASLLAMAGAAPAADWQEPMRPRVMAGVNIWAPRPPAPLPQAAVAVAAPVQFQAVQVNIIRLARQPRFPAHVPGERYPGYVGGNPALEPY